MLASQGGFAAHATMLRELGADAVEVRTPESLAGLDALVIPGGESTTIAKAIERDGLEPAIGVASHDDDRDPLWIDGGQIETVELSQPKIGDDQVRGIG